jgi:hypothetical protein
MRTGHNAVISTFTTYTRVQRTSVTGPGCGQVGIQFQDWRLTTVYSSSSRLARDSKEIPVAQDRVTVRIVNPHEVRLSVPRDALGADFSSTEPWIGFSVPVLCPPLFAAGRQTTRTVKPRI